MLPRAARLVTLAAALGAARPASAQTMPASAPVAAPAAPAADTVALPLDSALARALGRSEEVRLARSELELAETQVTSARSAALPQIDGTLAYTRTFASPYSSGTVTIPDSLQFNPDSTATVDDRLRYLERMTPIAGLGGLGQLFGSMPFGRENMYMASVTGTQTLYAGGRVGAALRIAGEYRAATRLGVRERLADIELQVRTAYYRALLAQEMEAIAQAAVDQAEAFLKQERLRLRAGESSDLDVMRAEVSLDNLRPALVQARNAASLAQLDLKRLVDVPLDRPVRLTTPLAPPSPEALAADDTTRREALASRAAVQAAERQVSIREEQVSVARGAFLPSVALRMSYGRQAYPNQVFRLGGQDWRTDWSATLGVSVPLFSGFRHAAEMEQAQVQLEQERLRLAQLRENVQLQYEQARGERERAAATIDARQHTVQQAQRVYDLTVLRHDKGLATQLEVSDARLALLQARTNLAQALADFYIADASVLRATGELGSGAERRPAAPAAPAVPPSSATPPSN